MPRQGKGMSQIERYRRFADAFLAIENCDRVHNQPVDMRPSPQTCWRRSIPGTVNRSDGDGMLISLV